VGQGYLAKIVRGSVAGSLAIGLGFLVAGLPRWAVAVVAGNLWSLANLYGLRFLLVRWLRPGAERRRDPATVGLTIGLLVKFPILYGVGYLMLRSEWFRIEGLMLGFVVPFAACFLDALGHFRAERRQAAAR
jgi:hypothetical protein